MRTKSAADQFNNAFPKSPTGISGLDEITGGGLPEGRTTLICGGPGCGKTLMGVEFLVCGAMRFHEPGVYITFEESAEELTANAASLGKDLKKLVKQKLLAVDHVLLDRSQIEESGEYDLEGLFVRIEQAVKEVKAKRIVLDTLEALFAGLQNEGLVRAEIRRLFRWLKDKGLTAVITAEKGDKTFSRHGLEEYVSDCVILLDHRVTDQIATRRIRIVKYRGSPHGTNEYPFLIDAQGVAVLPVSSLTLDHPASTERLSSGIAKLDLMMGGKGYFKGSTILVSGTAGTGKTSISATFATQMAKEKKKALYFCFEESKEQLFRNMSSIGLNMRAQEKRGFLKVIANRPSFFGLEMHLLAIHKIIESEKPEVVVIDPVSNLVSIGTPAEIKLMLTRLIDYLKQNEITTIMTSLTSPTATNHSIEDSEVGISSLVDTWILVRELEYQGERNRGLYMIKSRGMAHSKQVREFVLTDEGIELVDVYVTPDGVLTGSARRAQEAYEKAREEIFHNRKLDTLVQTEHHQGSAHLRKSNGKSEEKNF